MSQTAEFIIRQVIERGCLNSSVKRNLLGLGELIPASVVEPVHLRHCIGNGFLRERSDPDRLLLTSPRVYVNDAFLFLIFKAYSAFKQRFFYFCVGDFFSALTGRIERRVRLSPANDGPTLNAEGIGNVLICCALDSK